MSALILILNLFTSFSPDGEDFLQLTSDITFGSLAHAWTDYILFRIIDDDLEEPPEEFLILVGPVAATITIIDDDGKLRYISLEKLQIHVNMGFSLYSPNYNLVIRK